jgi:hypothetical protein
MATYIECSGCKRDNDGDRASMCWHCGQPIDLGSLDIRLTEAVIERFADGDDEALPTPLMNLPEAFKYARSRAERYMRWMRACDELMFPERHGEEP